MRILLLIVILFSLQCEWKKEEETTTKTEQDLDTPLSEKATKLHDEIGQKIPIANAFDYPVGKPDGKGYYNAQKFGINKHLGDDWNANTGGNSDLGDPIYAIGNGKVIKAKDEGGGWGNVIIIRHRLPNETEVESLYAHCERMDVRKGDLVERGQQIGTIGNADGAYLAHLHFELRTQIGMETGPGYSGDTSGYIDPTKFIEEHRNIEDH